MSFTLKKLLYKLKTSKKWLADKNGLNSGIVQHKNLNSVLSNIIVCG